MARVSFSEGGCVSCEEWCHVFTSTIHGVQLMYLHRSSGIGSAILSIARTVTVTLFLTVPIYFIVSLALAYFTPHMSEVLQKAILFGIFLSGFEMTAQIVQEDDILSKTKRITVVLGVVLLCTVPLYVLTAFTVTEFVEHIAGVLQRLIVAIAMLSAVVLQDKVVLPSVLRFVRVAVSRNVTATRALRYEMQATPSR